MLDRHRTQAAAGEGAAGIDAADGTLIAGMQAPLVTPLGHEAAHVRVHPPAHIQQDPTSRVDHVGAVQHVLQHRSTGSFRMVGLVHLRQLLWVAQQHDVPRAAPRGDGAGERHLARLVHEQQVEGVGVLAARQQPCRAGHQVELAGAGLLGVVHHRHEAMRAVVAVPLVDARERPPLLGRVHLHGPEEVLDGRMAVGGDRDAPARREGRHHHAGPAVGLTGAGRPLDREVGTVEPEGGAHEVVDGRAEASRGEPGRLTAQQGADRGVRGPAIENGPGHVDERLPDHLRIGRFPADQRRRTWRVGPLSTPQDQAVVADLDQFETLAGERIGHLADGQFHLLRRESVRVVERLLVRLRRDAVVELHEPHRVALVHQVLRGHAAQFEVPPPLRLVLAVVVQQQVPQQAALRGIGIVVDRIVRQPLVETPD